MRLCRGCTLAVFAVALTCSTALTLNAAEPSQGFNTVIEPNFTGEELRAHEDLWGLKVELRPFRLAYVPTVNPRTGEKSSEMVWYLVYKIINNPAPKPPQGTESAPVNVQDPSPPAICVPRATLVLEDPDIHGAVVDSIVPEALPEILRREQLPLKTSVQMAGPLPKPGDPKYGVFMFRGVNHRTTVFSVYLSGFSNAYKIGKDESGKPMILRRTIQVPYKRFADRYDQFAKEIRQIGEPKWIYVPDEAPIAKK